MVTDVSSIEHNDALQSMEIVKQELNRLRSIKSKKPEDYFNIGLCYQYMQDIPRALAHYYASIPGSYPQDFFSTSILINQLYKNMRVMSAPSFFTMAIWYAITTIPLIIFQLMWVLLFYFFLQSLVVLKKTRYRSLKHFACIGLFGIWSYVYVAKITVHSVHRGILLCDTMLKTGPADTYESLSSIGAGEYIECISMQNDWSKIKGRSTLGWVRSDYIEHM